MLRSNLTMTSLYFATHVMWSSVFTVGFLSSLFEYILISNTYGMFWCIHIHFNTYMQSRIRKSRTQHAIQESAK